MLISPNAPRVVEMRHVDSRQCALRCHNASQGASMRPMSKRAGIGAGCRVGAALVGLASRLKPAHLLEQPFDVDDRNSRIIAKG